MLFVFVVVVADVVVDVVGCVWVDVVGGGVDYAFEDLCVGVVLCAPIRQELNPCLELENAIMQSPCRHGLLSY